MRRGLMWFREDLRAQDNTALAVACDENEQILGVYIIDQQMWHEHDIAACRVEFILRNLKELQLTLEKLHIPLLVIETKATSKTLFIFNELINSYQIDTLYFNQQYEWNELQRDTMIKQSLATKACSFIDQVIFPPEKLLTQSKTPYTIFTPYKRNFILHAEHAQHLRPLSAIKKREKFPLTSSLYETLAHQDIIVHSKVPEKLDNYKSSIPTEYWPGGEIAAHKRLHKFIHDDIQKYQQHRDFPAYRGTSKLSAYLANGVLSPRQCFSAAIEANHGRLQNGNPGIDTWISELIWREFYKQIICNFPHVCKYKAFKKETDQWPWRHDAKLFDAWKNACTGYPLIDAAMRQLHQTGWMHNRLRMVVAMFLTKDCFIDWRWGEKYFMQHLIDGDLAANNGGWQWAASTGCDAVPYFRVFSPIRQSERFDPEGEFIKKYCPELKDVPSKLLHDPSKLPANIHYPKPIVFCKNTRAMLTKLLGNKA